METPRRIRKRKVAENAEARSIRDQDRMRLREQEERRKILHAKLAESSQDVDVDMDRIIINEAKTDDQGFIYFDKQIAKCIKPHQIEGVRFMWSQIVSGGDRAKGCLLSQTMGLGKTMQV
jgi:SNF2 family DNA or RNA helicase